MGELVVKDTPWIYRKVMSLWNGVTFVVHFVLQRIVDFLTYVRRALLETIQAWLGKAPCMDCLIRDVEIARANERVAHSNEKSLNWQKLWREEQERAQDLQAKLDELSGINRASQPSGELKPIGGFQSLRSRTQAASRTSLEKRNQARNEQS